KSRRICSMRCWSFDLSGIFRFLSLLPFNITTNTGFLIFLIFPVEQFFYGVAQIAPVYRLIIIRTAIIKLSPINQFIVLIEKKEIRGTSGTKSFGNLLIAVIKIGKGKVMFTGLFSHSYRAVIRIFLHII